MGTRKGIRAQEQQARAGHELSGAAAGHREPDSQDGRRSIETPAQDDDQLHSAIGSTTGDESDDIDLTDEDDAADEENDLA